MFFVINKLALGFILTYSLNLLLILFLIRLPLHCFISPIEDIRHDTVQGLHGRACTMGPPLQTLHCRPYTQQTQHTVDLTQYTLHCSPYIVDPTQQTLHCRPYIVDPTQQTLHCRPYTVAPTQQPLHRRAYTVEPTLWGHHCRPYSEFVQRESQYNVFASR